MIRLQALFKSSVNCLLTLTGKFGQTPNIRVIDAAKPAATPAGLEEPNGSHHMDGSNHGQDPRAGAPHMLSKTEPN